MKHTLVSLENTSRGAYEFNFVYTRPGAFSYMRAKYTLFWSYFRLFSMILCSRCYASLTSIYYVVFSDNPILFDNVLRTREP